MGNKVLKYFLMSRVRSCSCHNTHYREKSFPSGTAGAAYRWVIVISYRSNMNAQKGACGFPPSICFPLN